ncbi:probable E3 ubiquitin-protein ligase HERC4 isoform X2 [Antedon mediterranea]|uniref:probable E3 ubiquitin-protein ligase HERC4 isoform X2 n=1 Tax=Antedon mediterranea TaxID=105859 RepID=UPI003AF70772
MFLSKNGEVLRLAKDLNQTWNEKLAEIKKEEDKTILCTSCITDATGSPDTVNISNVYCGGLNTCYLVTDGSLSRSKKPAEMIYYLEGVFKDLPGSSDIPKSVILTIHKLFSSAECLNSAFKSPDQLCSEDSPGLDLPRAKNVFKTVSEKQNILRKIDHAISSQLCPTLLTSPLDVEALRVYLLLLECPTMQYPESYLQSILAVAKALCNLSPKMSKVIDTWIGNYSAPNFEHLITIFKNVIVHLVMKEMDLFEQTQLIIAFEMLKKLSKINEEMDDIVSYAAFYIHMDKDIGMFQTLHLWEKYPFILENNVKMNMIIINNVAQQQEAINKEMWFRMFPLQFNPFFNIHMHPELQGIPALNITIDRERIVRSALEQLRRFSLFEDFKKPLKVQFKGEPGIDDGGPCKEFFLLIFKEILDPKFGMFTVLSKTGRIWFNAQYEDKSMFRMVGILCGLAIYNQVIVELPFPLALYKKLLNKPVFLSDMSQLEPTMASGLKDILDYDDYDLQDVFDYPFQFSSEFHTDIIDLKEGGKDIHVTFDNKQEFVDLYINCMFNESIKEQYSAFAEGFHQVCGGPILQMFHPEELMSLVIGNEIYDWEEFESLVEYRGIYNKDHKTIKYFWEVFHHELTEEERKKFLEFLTGSDRIPVQGMAQLKVIFQSVFGSTDFLPSAQTCYNYFNLPIYESKEKLRQKLMIALEYAHGFGRI